MVEQTEIKNAILSLNKEHPDWDSGQLSETLFKDIDENYINSLLSRECE